MTRPWVHQINADAVRPSRRSINQRDETCKAAARSYTSGRWAREVKPRYDAIAPWYAEATRDWSQVCLPYLPENLTKKRVLDLACGVGALSRILADRGADITAVYAPAEMRSHTAPAHKQYLHGDATSTRWWDGESFDGVVSNMALYGRTIMQPRKARIPSYKWRQNSSIGDADVHRHSHVRHA